MTSKQSILAILALVLITLSCGPGTPTPSPDPPAPPTDTTIPPTPTATPIPPDVTPPSPLPASHTGIILNDDECYDLDSGDAPYVRDDDCDIRSTIPATWGPTPTGTSVSSPTRAITASSSSAPTVRLLMSPRTALFSTGGCIHSAQTAVGELPCGVSRFSLRYLC
jgi:hypothetical protein